jgi:ribonuclease T1
MWRIVLVLWLTLFTFPAVAAIEDIALADLPPEVHDTLRMIRRGGPYPHRRDGLIFGNFERRLPAKPRGYYLEYTVRTPGVRTRGARRVIAGRGAPGDVRRAEYYYTEDHYQTFWRIRE